MTETELPWSVFNRRLRPFSFAVMLSTLTISWNVVRETAIGELLDGNYGHLVGAFGLIAVLLLLAGYWFKSDRLMAHGLLVATGVWTTAAIVLTFDIGLTAASSLLAWCWVAACGGSWLLEVSHR